MATTASQRLPEATRQAREAAWKVEELTEKLRAAAIIKGLAAADIAARVERFQIGVYRILGGDDQISFLDFIKKSFHECGVNLDDVAVRHAACGAVKGILKRNNFDTKMPPGLAPEPPTVHVPRPPKVATHEGVPSLGFKPGTPEAAKTPLTAAKLPTSLPPAPQLPPNDPRRSSAQLPSIRREPTVEKAFQSAAALLRSRYPEGTFQTMADFLADAYNDQEPNPEKNARRKLEKWTRQFWTGSDEEKSSPNFEKEIEKAFLAGFGDRYCKQQQRGHTEAVKKSSRG